MPRTRPSIRCCTSSNALVNLASRSRIRNPPCHRLLAQVDQQVPSLLGDPGRGRMVGDAGKAHLLACEPDKEQDLHALQQGHSGGSPHSRLCQHAATVMIPLRQRLPARSWCSPAAITDTTAPLTFETPALASQERSVAISSGCARRPPIARKGRHAFATPRGLVNNRCAGVGLDKPRTDDVAADAPVAIHPGDRFRESEKPVLGDGVGGTARCCRGRQSRRR